MSFKDTVYNITAHIPKGKVATYGQIALLAGNPKAARAVGSFMKTNPFAPRVPCHRVVAGNGSLTGYSAAGGVVKKKSMLIREGVRFLKEKVDMSRSRWDGKASLDA